MKFKTRLFVLTILFLKICLIFSVIIYALCYFLVDEYTDYEAQVPTASGRHKLCVVVPYRDRLTELAQFAPLMKKFLDAQDIDHVILVINQVDDFRFNRAALINVGWYEADRSGCDYMVMNDVDLIPINPKVPYEFPGIGTIRHITSPQYHPKYHYAKFIGGILMLTMDDFKKIDGMSNKYWGWGLEDDEFYLRIMEGSANLTRVENLTTNSTNTFLHLHGPIRKRDYTNRKDKYQWKLKRQRDKKTGLHNVQYRITGRTIETYQNSEVVFVHVKLFCDLKWTPYCIT